MYFEAKLQDNLTSQKSRVLVVDDSQSQRFLLASMLRRAGYEVIEAACAEDALQLCSDPSISLIISDWGMPGLDGPDFCRALRKIERPYAYFILITSRADRQERAEGLDSGADDFVTRPIDWVELRARIRAGERLLDLQNKMSAQNEVLNTTLGELQDLHTVLQNDLAEARKLQRSLVPPEIQRLDGCTIASRLVTCGQIGGDLIGHFPINETKIAVFSIDVSGHGIASALMMGRLSGLFASTDPDQNISYSTWLDGERRLDAPHRVVARLNRLMLSELDTDIYFTCVFAYLDLTTGEVELCQAGHPHPMIMRHDGTVEHMGRGGPPVGLLPSAQYELIKFSLSPRDRLLLYSDGLSEAMTPKGEMLGDAGLTTLLKTHQGLSPQETMQALEDSLRVFTGNREFEDDISMLLLEFTPRQGTNPGGCGQT